MVERKVRWNRTLDSGDQIRQRYTYYFAIVNEPREIMRIRDRLFLDVPHASDVEELGDFGVASSNGLHCQIFSFQTDFSDLPDFSKIYQGDVRQDRGLYERKLGDWEPYFERLIED